MNRQRKRDRKRGQKRVTARDLERAVGTSPWGGYD